MPAIDVIEVPDGRQFIIDGHHRYIASKRTGVPMSRNITKGGGPIGFPSWKHVKEEVFEILGD